MILLDEAFERGKLVGKALFYLALAALGVWLIIRMNKKKK